MYLSASFPKKSDFNNNWKELIFYTIKAQNLPWHFIIIIIIFIIIIIYYYYFNNTTFKRGQF